MKWPHIFSSDFLQDTEGGASMKRLAFALFCIFFIVISAAMLFHGIDVKLLSIAQTTLDKTQDIIKWLGAYILADKAPSIARAITGAPKPPEN